MMQMMVKSPNGRYRRAVAHEILEAASAVRVQQLAPRKSIRSPREGMEVLGALVDGYGHERFAAAFLDTRHQLIACEILFTGTIDGAAVYPREVVQRALEHGASALIIAHNHPSGVAEPSEADRGITLKLVKALALIEVRLLDHFVFAGTDTPVSLAERGWI